MKSLLIAILASAVPMVWDPGEPEPLSRQAILTFELKNILEADGLSPELNAEANLTFKDGGNTYVLEVKDDSGELCYARLWRYHKYAGGVTREAVELFNIREAPRKVVKVMPAKRGYHICAELLLTDSKYFKAVYRRLMKLMDDAQSDLRRKCPVLSDAIARDRSRAEARSMALADSIAAAGATGLTADLNLVVEQKDSMLIIHPVATLTAPADRQATYPVKLRLYRNNTLMQDDNSPVDFSAADTLSGALLSRALLMKPWVDSLPANATYRCELWHKAGCIATTSYSNK